LERKRVSLFLPLSLAAVKLFVAVYSLSQYIPRYIRLTYIADGPARGIEAYKLAFGDFGIFQTYQFLPLQLWLWASLLKIYPDIYWTGTALNITAAVGTTVILYFLGRELAGPAAGTVAALLFIFSPVHHFLTLSEGMAESLLFFWSAAGVYLATRAAKDSRAAAAAGLCFAAAALTRYEAAAALILYSAYRLFRARPQRLAGWLLWVAPLAVVGILMGQKALVASHLGVWTDLAGVKADSEVVLPGARWFERVGYGLSRVWSDGRVAGVLGVCGALIVWAKGVRSESRLVIWGGLAVFCAGILATFAIVGLGLGPERHFAIVLMFLFPFAGLAAVNIWNWATGRAAKIAASILFASAAAYTVYFDAAIKDYGYGFGGPCWTCQSVDAELALKLRDLWRRGELKPEEIIYIEENVDNYSTYAILAYSNHPLNFYVCPPYETERDLWYLKYILKRNDIRIAIFLNQKTRRQVKGFNRAYKKFAVIYESPAHTVVVRRAGWGGRPPDFSLTLTAGSSRVIR
jgi:hypothetical protein